LRQTQVDSSIKAREAKSERAKKRRKYKISPSLSNENLTFSNFAFFSSSLSNKNPNYPIKNILATP